MPSGEEIERLLKVAHKTVAMGGFAINAMLSRRKLNLKMIEEAAKAVSVANDSMKLLLTLLRGP
jgi:hypothetical protein